VRSARSLLAASLLVALTAACMGGSTGTSGGRATRHAEPTRVVITYFATFWPQCAGAGVRNCFNVPLHSEPDLTQARIVPPMPSAQLVRCPEEQRAGLRCFTLTREPDGTQLVVAQRELSCSPRPRGGYADPADACRALSDYVRFVRRARGVACSCAASPWQASMLGVVQGRRVAVGLDGCCLPAGALAAQRVLTPDLEVAPK
jgi:subtilisin inhibitor-like